MRTASGGLIDRKTQLRFRFDGRDYRGFAGDTLGSALLAHGVKLVGRSFKYHRPRGILTAGPQEPHALGEFRYGAPRQPQTKAKKGATYYGPGAGGAKNFAPPALWFVGGDRGLFPPSVYPP